MFATSNPYTSKIPTGTLNTVVFTQPQHVQIAWPSISGNTKPQPKVTFLSRLFG